jgi:hypothetical protein
MSTPLFWQRLMPIQHFSDNCRFLAALPAFLLQLELPHQPLQHLGVAA